jgi:predicted AAA+ superfamily ATPase
MWPLNFKEFLQFKEVYQPHIELERQQSFLRTYHDKYQMLYEEFIEFGGFPEVVLANEKTDKEDYLSDVINSYIELDIKLLSDFEMTNSLYKLMLLLAGRAGSKVDFSKLSNIIGLNRHKVKDYISLFEHTFFIRLVKPFSRGIDKELTKQPKIYFSDTGILNKLQKGLSGGVQRYSRITAPAPSCSAIRLPARSCTDSVTTGAAPCQAVRCTCWPSAL